MSTRWYPLYQRGNPQLRVFLPNFWMKMVRPHPRQMPNLVNFQCSMEMTKYDIKNYLEKIYQIPVINIRTKIAMGKFRKDIGKGYIVKDDDIKYAFVTLPKNMKFEFPDLFSEQKSEEEEQMKSLEEAKKGFKSYISRNKDRPDIPSWAIFWPKSYLQSMLQLPQTKTKLNIERAIQGTNKTLLF